MIDYDVNKAENESILHRYVKNKPWSRHRHKYTK